MACNCVAKEQIDELYRRYGSKTDTKKLSGKEKFVYYAVRVAVVIALIPIVPAIFLFVLYKGLFDDDHKISLMKFFNLKKPVVVNGGE